MQPKTISATILNILLLLFRAYHIIDEKVMKVMMLMMFH